MKDLKAYITEIILQEARKKKKKKKQSNKPPAWIKKGTKAMHKDKEVEVIEPDIRGPFSLVDTKGDGEGDTSVNHDELEKTDEES